MNYCTGLLILMGHLETALQSAERLQEGANRQKILDAINANLAVVEKEYYEHCRR